MDIDNDLLEVQHGVGQPDPATHLGLRVAVPINRDNYTEDQWEDLWQNVLNADYAFEDTTRGDKAFFFRTIISPGTYNFEIPGKAFAQITNAGEGSCALFHFMVFDEIPTSQLVNAGREIFEFAFRHLKIHRLTATVPSFNQRVQRMASLLHMKFEGSMRQAFQYQGSWWNIEIYSLLEGEWAKGRM
jgi:hypothetical protein